jgi:uncharacterized membrane protein YeaQ/YmgE (transglycosylase-associated protein family)
MMENLLYFIIIGLAAGWLAGKIMRGSGFGLIGNLVVGVVGALIGAFVFEFIGISTDSLVGSLVMSVVGAVILLYLLQLLKRL